MMDNDYASIRTSVAHEFERLNKLITEQVDIIRTQIVEKSEADRTITTLRDEVASLRLQLERDFLTIVNQREELKKIKSMITKTIGNGFTKTIDLTV